MIRFEPLRTARLDVRLRELSFGDEIALCQTNESAHEATMSEFLRRAVEYAGVPSPRHVSDPRAWTVGERLFALAHYCVHTREDRPDYAVTDTSTLSDYLDVAREPAEPSTFDEADDTWTLSPLTGAMAEAIESLQGSTALTGVAYWLTAAMAAQLLRASDLEKGVPDAVVDAAGYVKWLAKRIPVMAGLHSSTFDRMYAQYRVALDRDTQFFRVWFDHEGVIVLPKLLPNGAQAVTPAARFLVRSVVGGLALSVTGKSE
ncbi:hypothetical protein [Burkholderia ubonensis]|uniref:Uncharacterized protein n=1 Tax=Burkholderia ubonensis TaxID=101571 RepID=A0ABD4DZF4_9BURK|nr:hypothetical protein [Burkholderia ubonensis]KVN83489.1 hypothetical protein WJ68_16390 [Burkholderia ubonensis]